MFRRHGAKDGGQAVTTRKERPNPSNPDECIDLLEDLGPGCILETTITSRGHSNSFSTVTPDQDSMDRSSCAGMCLCLCQCHYPPPENVIVQVKKTKGGFIGKIRKKLVSIRKKEYIEEDKPPAASPSPRPRTRSPDRIVLASSRSRTLPRGWKAVPLSNCSEGRTTSAAGGVNLDFPADITDGCTSAAIRNRSKCTKHRTRVQDEEESFQSANVFTLSKPHRRSEINRIRDKDVKIGRPHHSAVVIEFLHDDIDQNKIFPDTGYGHASAPFFNGLDDALQHDAGNGTDGEETDCHLDGPQIVQPAPPVYDQVKEPSNGWSLAKELFKLPKYGWYWGPISRCEAEEKLTNHPDGSFLLRDSSDERYLLSLSFRSYGRTLHTRIEHCNGLFSFYAQTESEGYSSIVDLIEHSMTDSQSGVFCYSRARTPGSPSFPVRLAKPISRFTQVRSLQYLCRFVIRQHTRVDYIQRLPLPTRIKGWLEEMQY